MSQRSASKVLLLDEDQKFAKRLSDRLRTQGVDLHWRRSLFELGSVGRLSAYDMLLVEPLIGPVNGLEIAEYADTFFPGLPVVLIGDGALPVNLKQWPKSVAGSVCKDQDIDDLVAEINRLGLVNSNYFPYRKAEQQLRYAST